MYDYANKKYEAVVAKRSGAERRTVLLECALYVLVVCGGTVAAFVW